MPRDQMADERPSLTQGVKQSRLRMPPRSAERRINLFHDVKGLFFYGPSSL